MLFYRTVYITSVVGKNAYNLCASLIIAGGGKSWALYRSRVRCREAVLARLVISISSLSTAAGSFKFIHRTFTAGKISMYVVMTFLFIFNAKAS